MTCWKTMGNFLSQWYLLWVQVIHVCKLPLPELYCSTFTLHVILEIMLQYLTQDNQLIITISSKMMTKNLHGNCVVPENIHTPPRRVYSSLTPHPPGFSKRALRYSPHPWNFHDFSTWSPLPVGNSKSTNKETSLIYFYLLKAIIKFSRSRL